MIIGASLPFALTQDFDLAEKVSGTSRSRAAIWIELSGSISACLVASARDTQIEMLTYPQH